MVDPTASFWLHDIWHPLRGDGYQFWSGIAGSFIVGSGIWASAVSIIRRHNCHSPWCPWPGRYPTADGAFLLCRKHYKTLPGTPDRTPTLEDIHAAHAEAIGETDDD